MSYRRAFNWNHDFPRLVRQLGFKFITDRPKLLIDWNLIGCVDIESIIFNSEVTTLERHINDVIYYSLQGEEIKILDPKFVKLFRLAQLTIEYLIFCLHYLDKGFVLLQDNISVIRKENEELREEVFQKEKSIQKYKKRLSDLQSIYKNNGDVSTEEIFQCEICKKQFINEVFLNAHQTRRQHTTISNPQPPDIVTEQFLDNNSDTQKLFIEIKELKERLNNTEYILKSEKADKPVSDTIDSCITKIDKDIQVDLISKSYSDDSVQCNLGEDDEKKREQLTTIQMELKQWREDEANKIFDQLEKIKEKFNENVEKVHQTTITDNLLLDKGTSDNELHSFQELEEKFDKKLESNIERLKNELTNQERNWRDKLASLELKNETAKLNAIKSPATPKQATFRIQHNSPVIIQHESDSSSSHKRTKFERKSVQTSEIITKDEATLVIPVAVNTSTQATPTNDDIEYKAEIVSKSDSISDENLRVEKSKEYLEEENSEVPKFINRNSNDSIFKLRTIEVEKDEHEELKTSVLNLEVIETHQNKPKSVETTSRNRILNLEKHSITNLKNLGHDESFLYEFRKTIEGVVHTSLQELGVDPQWKSIPQSTFEDHLKRLQHSQKFQTRTHPNYNEFKNEIINKIEHAVSEQNMKVNVSNTSTTTPLRLPKRRHIRSKTQVTKKTTTSKLTKPRKELSQTLTTEEISKQSLKMPTSKPSIEALPKQKFTEPTIHSRDQVNSMRLFRRAKSLHLLNRQKDKSTEDKGHQITKTKSEILHQKPEKYEEKSHMLSSILKVKDKVCSVFKSPQRANILQKAGGDAFSNNEAPNVTQGVYKLTAFDEKNKPIQSSQTIKSITPVGKKKSIFQRSENIENNDSTTLSESEETTNFSKIKTVHFKNNRNLEKSVINTVIGGPAKTQKFDAFMTKSEQTAAKQIIKIDVTKPAISMYGDNSESSNISEQSFSPFKIPSSSTPKKPPTPVEMNFKTNLPDSNFLKPTSSFVPVKKKVIFDLDTDDSSQNSDKSIKPLVGGLGEDEMISKNKVMVQQGSGFTVNQFHLATSENKSTVNDGDSTSISSSVFDGSIKTTIDDHKDTTKDSTKDTQNKTKETKFILNDDDLVLSDFDLSTF
ncbi:zinc finger protein DZIP1 [Chrysoperla carnea]|uniref:zinc finger protein DZIP1 n=1 Tax=Chrysoperla carnea TaxID=189513 RepID=UPI001D05F15C|nr:zinc finger protein DZIP1 [Chrysoperla carnea]